MRPLLLIDRRTCRGAGMCEVMSPELFALDDDGLARMAEPRLLERDVELARTVAECCPTGAITVTSTQQGEES